MSEPVQLVGLDFGTTTSSAVVAEAVMVRNAVTGRTELDQMRECYRSAKVFTPFEGELLDERCLGTLLDHWLTAGGVEPARVFGGGALLTGFTARAANATALVQLVRARFGEGLVARADDPCLESWLAFMGSCAELSRSLPERPVLNLDIGGGTTNLALGQAGTVTRTGCLFVGARHFQVEPGSYRLTRVSPLARALCEQVRIPCQCGAPLAVEAIVDFYVGLLEAIVRGERLDDDPRVRSVVQVPMQLPPELGEVIVTLSGGVGELVYDAVEGRGWPSTTAFGDLGIDLARRLLDSPLLGPHLRRFTPAGRGRATVFGLLRHSTEISGSTVFLSDPEVLPLADVPIFGTVSEVTSDAHWRDLLALAQGRGGCLQVAFAAPGAASVRQLGLRLQRLLADFPTAKPLVLLVRENLGKTLGSYATAWGPAPRPLVVIDEIALRDAQFVHIGRRRDQVIPVSYYGLRP
jgi:ethanolamine utilization protein EutA